ncbi:MAG: oxidoreductase [Bacteroidota bacterium]|nr:oxidoreductase [Bacteroidota bacterium]
MRFIKIFSLAVLINLCLVAAAQTPVIQVLESGKKVSIRGLSVVNDQVIWASGSKGSVARSTDGGKNFTWTTVPGYEKNDFRDIEAFDDNTALIMAITEPAAILKTTDGGLTWRKVFEDTTKGAFWDAMNFSYDKSNKLAGALVGDPIKGQIFYALTFDAGETWERPHAEAHKNIPAVAEGEAFFASSGTNVILFDKEDFHPTLYAVSGGKVSALWDMFTWTKYPLPIMQGAQSTGANSLAINSDYSRGVVVGGDFTKDTIGSNNCVLLEFSNKINMSTPQTPPHGYRSCVIYLDKNNLLTCGTSGVDISKDGGKNWELISRESYHVCQKAKKGKAVFLAGSNGRIAKLVW